MACIKCQADAKDVQVSTITRGRITQTVSFCTVCGQHWMDEVSPFTAAQKKYLDEQFVRRHGGA